MNVFIVNYMLLVIYSLLKTNYLVVYVSECT